jgi:hypothetical protein
VSGVAAGSSSRTVTGKVRRRTSFQRRPMLLREGPLYEECMSASTSKLNDEYETHL